jgi:hypothetical protein
LTVALLDAATRFCAILRPVVVVAPSIFCVVVFDTATRARFVADDAALPDAGRLTGVFLAVAIVPPAW